MILVQSFYHVILILHLQIAYWDDRSVYYRQDVRTLHDNFLRATAYLQVATINCSPVDVLHKTLQSYNDKPQCLTDSEVSSPSEILDKFLQVKPIPSDLKKFIDFNEQSSIRLKAELLIENTTREAVQAATKRIKPEWNDWFVWPFNDQGFYDSSTKDWGLTFDHNGWYHRT